MLSKIAAGLGIVGLLLIGANLIMVRDLSWLSWALVLFLLLGVGEYWRAARAR